MEAKRYDVVISGYSLTGVAIASLLSRQGHRVAVLERWPTMYGLPRPRPSTEVVATPNRAPSPQHLDSGLWLQYESGYAAVSQQNVGNRGVRVVPPPKLALSSRR